MVFEVIKKASFSYLRNIYTYVLIDTTLENEGGLGK